LLPQIAVESGLSEYYKYQDSIDAGNFLVLESPYRLAARSLIPLTVQLAIREGCGDLLSETGNAIGFVSECLLDIDKEEFERGAESLVSSQSLRQSLREHCSRSAWVTINNQGNIVQIERMLPALRSTQPQ
jgi:hypothetical protein